MGLNFWDTQHCILLMRCKFLILCAHHVAFATLWLLLNNPTLCCVSGLGGHPVFPLHTRKHTGCNYTTGRDQVLFRVLLFYHLFLTKGHGSLITWLNDSLICAAISCNMYSLNSYCLILNIIY